MPVLHLLPVPVSEDALGQIPPATLQAAAELRTFIVERGKTARMWLRKFNHPLPQSEINIIELPKHSEINLQWFNEYVPHESVGLMSEAGSPCIADPGSILVDLARAKGWTVKPYTGPVSLMLALMASGLNGQEFQFHGYLPQKKHDLKQALKSIEAEVIKGGASQLFIETPYRNAGLMDTILSEINPALRLHISLDLTSEREYCMTRSIAQWKKNLPELLFQKVPAIFILGK